MNNTYRKDRSYIKQRLEYVSPVDYIIGLENEIEILQQENERLIENRKEAIEYIKHSQNYGKEKIIYINGDDLLNILGGDEE